MKKLLVIIALGLLLNTNAQAKHRTFDDPFYHWNRFEAKGSENHYKFQSNLREDKDVLKEIKNTKKTGLISYLLFEDDKIVIDESDIPDKTRQGDKIIKKFISGKMKIATKKDWKTEYLSPTISVKAVNGVGEAIDHINKYGSSHTDSIVTKNKKTAKKFLSNIKSSIAIHNASTQFADGGEFGFGSEVGISTNKLHPRGPIGIDQLTTYKYILEGKGQIRK